MMPKLVKADAWGADFSEASMRNVRAVHLDVQGGNLQKADLTASYCHYADFSDTNMEFEILVLLICAMHTSSRRSLLMQTLREQQYVMPL